MIFDDGLSMRFPWFAGICHLPEPSGFRGSLTTTLGWLMLVI
jgi:hypothetical protein